jgi:hypothetical protein
MTTTNTQISSLIAWAINEDYAKRAAKRQNETRYRRGLRIRARLA